MTMTEVAIDTAEVVAKLAAHKRPAFVPIIESGDSLQSSSKFSGIAWINSDEEWPTCGYCNKPLQLFLQLNLSEMPDRRSYWPATGFLQVFYCTTEDTYCQEAGADMFSPFGKFQRTRVVTPTGSSRAYEESPVEIPLPSKTITGWKEVADYPASSELDLRFEGLLNEEESTHLFDLATGFDKDESINVISDKLAGWPMWLQDPGYPDCPECGEEMDYIFQIASEDNLDYMFGDCGIAMIFQCKKDPHLLGFSWAGS